MQKTKCRKIVSLLLAVLMITALFVTTAVSAYAESDGESKGDLFRIEFFDVKGESNDSVVNPAGLRLPEVEASKTMQDGIVFRVQGDGVEPNVESKDYFYGKDEDRAVRLSFDGAPAEGSQFFWQIEGNYELVQGELTDPEIVIKPCKDSDIRVRGCCDDKHHHHHRSTYDEATADSSTTSPKTGDMTMFIVMIVLAAGAVCVFAVKKVKE